MPNSVVQPTQSPIYSFIGLQFQFLALPEHTKDNLCLMRNVMVPGLFVPLHSHTDSEVFHVLEGSLEVYQEGAGWTEVRAGEILALESHVKHALRIREHCICMTTTGSDLMRFFLEASVPLNQAEGAVPKQFERLAKAAEAGRIWLASPDENAAIGITLQ